MISDVLSEALANIEEYQDSLPEVYNVLAPEINVVKTLIVALQLVLDSSTGGNADHAKHVEALRAAIGDLHVYGIVAAIGRLSGYVQTERERLKNQEGL